MTVKFPADRPLTDEEEAEIQRMIASDPDAPEASAEELAQARPFREVHPELAAKMEADIAARNKTASLIEQGKRVSLRLSPDVLARLRGMGRDWQRKVDDILRKAVGL